MRPAASERTHKPGTSAPSSTRPSRSSILARGHWVFLEWVSSPRCRFHCTQINGELRWPLELIELSLLTPHFRWDGNRNLSRSQLPALYEALASRVRDTLRLATIDIQAMGAGGSRPRQRVGGPIARDRR